MLCEKSLSRILSALYDAPLEPRRWREFLSMAALAVDGEAAGLLMHNFTDARSAMSIDWGFHPEHSV